MSVLSYLEQRARTAILSDAEKESIDRSIATLAARLQLHFGASIVEKFRFGSSTRGTILPRSMDQHSDIDYMVVFQEAGTVQQTYLDRLRAFAEKYYSRSDIKQSSPTIVLELNHIKFDLVPALRYWLGGYRIIGKNGAWQETNPNDFNAKLTEKNNLELFKIKPTIRLVKYWNAVNGYVYDSYEFEKWIVGLNFGSDINQTQYLFKVFDNLNPYAENTQWRRERIERAKGIVQQVREFERSDMPNSAEREVKKLIPD